MDKVPDTACVCIYIYWYANIYRQRQTETVEEDLGHVVEGEGEGAVLPPVLTPPHHKGPVAVH
jgi:hypothetical protein